MNLIELEQCPSQELGVGDYRIRLNFNYMCNRWSFSLFTEEGACLRAGDFIDVGMNLFESVGGSLVVANSVSCPDQNWYHRLVTPYADNIPQTVLVYDVQ